MTHDSSSRDSADSSEVERAEALAGNSGLQGLRRLADGMAHELKNPLSIIQLGLDVISRRLPADDQLCKVSMEQIECAVRRASDVISALADLSTDKLAFQVEDVNTCVEEAVSLCTHQAIMNNVDIDLSLSGEPLPARVNSGKLTQAFQCVILNGIQAMPGGGTLFVSSVGTKIGGLDFVGGSRSRDGLKSNDPVAAVKVRDQGVGMTESVRKRAFEPFYTTKPTGTGAGLGLSLTDNIVEVHKGLFTLENCPDGGTLATFYLKRAEE